MITFIFGELNRCNTYHIDDITKLYIPSFIIRRVDLKLQSLPTTPPIIKSYLLDIRLNDIVKLEDLLTFTKTLVQLPSFIDTLVHIPKYNFNPKEAFVLYDSVKVVDLKKTYKSDFKQYLQTTCQIEHKHLDNICSTLNYSLKLVEQNHTLLINKEYTKLVKADKSKSIEELLFNILSRKTTAYTHILNLADKYSKRWVVGELLTTLTELLIQKQRVLKKQVHITELAYWQRLLTLNIPIYNVFHLRNLLGEYGFNGLVIYLKEDL